MDFLKLTSSKQQRTLTVLTPMFWCERACLTSPSPGSRERCSPTGEYCAWPCPLCSPPQLTVLGLSSGTRSCPHALCKLLPFQQLRVKVEVANCLRKEDLGWEEVLLQRKPGGCISKCPRFLSPSRMLL